MKIYRVLLSGHEARSCLTCGRRVGEASGEPGEIEGVMENMAERAMLCAKCLACDLSTLQRRLWAAADRYTKTRVGYAASIFNAMRSDLQVISRDAAGDGLDD